MKKIPTLFVRDPEDRKHVLSEITPGCEWVLAGEGIATRKYDGTCVMYDGWGAWYARREVKHTQVEPDNFVEVEFDPETFKSVGWIPAEQSSFWKYLQEAKSVAVVRSGTYELIGPKINGNPEKMRHHVLVRHGNTPLDDVPRDYEGLRTFLLAHDYEGIVWHHPDGRMTKLKKRDFA